MTTTYAKRETVFERGEHQWRVEPQALVWIQPGGESLTILWRDVTSLRAAFAPTKWKPWRHLIEIRTRQGRRLTIDNSHFRKAGDFEDRSASFRPFALAVIERVGAAAPEARGWVGASPGGYAGQLLFMVLGLGAMILVLIALPLPLPGVVLIKLALIAVSLPTAALWAIRARPRQAAITAEAFAPGLPRSNG
ncbi:MAG: hypothetical protein GC145_14975 [Caulobacter sp.]|nr:hypothetical protein [Caulobacter sp.]